MAVKRNRFYADYALIPDIASSVQFGIAVKSLPISFLAGNADTVLNSGDRREIENTNQMLVLGVACVRDNAVLRILAINPGESAGEMIPFPESPAFPV